MQHTRLDPEKSGHSEEANVSKKKKSRCMEEGVKESKKVGRKTLFIWRRVNDWVGQI